MQIKYSWFVSDFVCLLSGMLFRFRKLTLESGRYAIEKNGTLDFILKELKIVLLAGWFDSIECRFINSDVT